VPALLTDVRRYIHEVLGLAVPEAKPWVHAEELPYFLKDAFQFAEIELLGQPIVLALARAEPRHSLSEVRRLRACESELPSTLADVPDHVAQVHRPQPVLLEE
jgi:hypothetical protein